MPKRQQQNTNNFKECLFCRAQKFPIYPSTAMAESTRPQPKQASTPKQWTLTGFRRATMSGTCGLKSSISALRRVAISRQCGTSWKRFTRSYLQPTKQRREKKGVKRGDDSNRFESHDSISSRHRKKSRTFCLWPSL